jgi:hypothetical protein
MKKLPIRSFDQASPAPDERWPYPLFDVEYPLGPSMSIGDDEDWLVGSPELPELKFSAVEFDPDKFTSDNMAEESPTSPSRSRCCRWRKR